jgi:hypothetical protein
MRGRLASIALITALLGAFFVAPLTASAQRAPAGSLDVTGTLEDGGTFVGTLSNLLFTQEAGQLVLTGVIEGTATDAAGNVTEIAEQAFEVAATPSVQQDGGECQILFLDLAPIFLDVLGLQVDISQIVIDITAVEGPGNLLGNLLCAILGLLDRGGPAGGLAGLLNNLLRNLLG